MPARDDVGVEVVADRPAGRARTGSARVETVGLEGSLEGLERSLFEAGVIEQLLAAQLGVVAGVFAGMTIT